jgi:hypothetical protein
MEKSQSKAALAFPPILLKQVREAYDGVVADDKASNDDLVNNVLRDSMAGSVFDHHVRHGHNCGRVPSAFKASAVHSSE